MEKVLCLRMFYRCIRQVNVFCPVKRHFAGRFATSGSFVRPNAISPDKSSLLNITLAARHL